MIAKFQVSALLLLFFCASSLSLTMTNADLPVIGGPGCDDKGASASVGACTSDKRTCAGYTNQNSCENYAGSIVLVYTIKDDFPTGCKDVEKSNCNEPLANCYGPVNCTWANGACNTSGDPKHWRQEPKKTSVACKAVVLDPK